MRARLGRVRAAMDSADLGHEGALYVCVADVEAALDYPKHQTEDALKAACEAEARRVWGDEFGSVESEYCGYGLYEVRLWMRDSSMPIIHMGPFTGSKLTTLRALHAALRALPSEGVKPHGLERVTNA